MDDLSFTVDQGTVTGFLGPNGPGKTTTMKLILGLEGPTSGSVRVNGKSYAELAAPSRGGCLAGRQGGTRRPQGVRPPGLARPSNKIALKRVDEVLGIVGLEAVVGRRTGTFSLGMSQRLGIAAALSATRRY